MIRITREPRGETYQALLRLAIDRASEFSLVWQPQFGFDETALRCEESLRPFLATECVSPEWPGTVLHGHTAIVRRYELNAGSLKHLAVAEGLYSWLSPALPEDLAFYRSTGPCWLGSIAHEQDAWIDDPTESLEALARASPGIALELE